MNTSPWHSWWQPPGRPSHTPARRVVRPTGGIVRGKFASRKNKQTVEFEQLLELDLMYLLEAAPSVLHTCRWPPLRERQAPLRVPSFTNLLSHP